jgi:hypothetical protein
MLTISHPISSEIAVQCSFHRYFFSSGETYIAGPYDEICPYGTSIALQDQNTTSIESWHSLQLRCADLKKFAGLIMLPESHPNKIQAMRKLADTYMKMGLAARAEDPYWRVVHGRERDNGPSSYASLSSWIDLVSCIAI